MDSERVIFTEEASTTNYVKIIVAGELDDTLLAALEAYVKRQRKRIYAAPEIQTTGNGAHLARGA